MQLMKDVVHLQVSGFIRAFSVASISRLCVRCSWDAAQGARRLRTLQFNPCLIWFHFSVLTTHYLQSLVCFNHRQEPTDHRVHYLCE